MSRSVAQVMLGEGKGTVYEIQDEDAEIGTSDRCFFFSSRRRHTRWNCDGVQTCALPIYCLHALRDHLVKGIRAIQFRLFALPAPDGRAQRGHAPRDLVAATVARDHETRALICAGQ